MSVPGHGNDNMFFDSGCRFSNLASRSRYLVANLQLISQQRTDGFRSPPKDTEIYSL